MNNITVEKLLDVVRNYNEDALEDVRRACEYADSLHKGQVRQSGEPYISHPLNVAYILAELHSDKDILCAGLLHLVVL